MQEKQSLRFLVVKAHPHDFTHCAGTCGIHAAQGDAVTVVSMTNGVGTHNERLYDELLKPEAEQDASIINQTSEEYAQLKEKEFREVCALFGVTDVRILAFPDKPFHKTPEAVEALRQIIYDVRPHVLITQRPYLSGHHGMASGAHNDHDETAFAILEAQGLAGTPSYGSRQRPHTIAATYYPGVYFMPDEIDFYVDISEWKDQRVQAEILFSSQGHTEAFARKRIEINAGHMGWAAGREYAEGFVRARPEVMPRIIVPESALERASEPRQNHLKRISGELK
jgi:LmbE family N-acetylglucosaminyl deacetylase